MNVRPLDYIAQQIKSASTDKKILIAIEGFGGSGKTTVAQKLVALLGNAFVVHIDDFIVKEKLNERS